LPAEDLDLMAGPMVRVGHMAPVVLAPLLVEDLGPTAGLMVRVGRMVPVVPLPPEDLDPMGHMVLAGRMVAGPSPKADLDHMASRTSMTKIDSRPPGAVQ
jgi:hypothetical protein